LHGAHRQDGLPGELKPSPRYGKIFLNGLADSTPAKNRKVTKWEGYVHDGGIILLCRVHGPRQLNERAENPQMRVMGCLFITDSPITRTHPWRIFELSPLLVECDEDLPKVSAKSPRFDARDHFVKLSGGLEPEP
jgi:hypothetical protein